MGLLVDGIWQDEEQAVRTQNGHFVRPVTRYRSWITPDGKPGPSGDGGFAAARGRYHLYVALACPWAHRTITMRMLKGLEDVVSMSVVEPLYGPHGWRFGGTMPGATPDTVNGKSELAEIYLLADPHFTGRVTVPVLWDKERRTIVNNESAEIIRMLNSALDRFTNVTTDYYPQALHAEIDQINALVYGAVNNGVHQTVRHTRPDRRTALTPALSRWSGHHRGGLAAVHDPGPIRCGLLRPFQMQPAPHHRLSEPVELSARALSSTGRRRHREHGSHQDPLLRHP
jgi:glutathionyl-hydroquinone reductase